MYNKTTHIVEYIVTNKLYILTLIFLKVSIFIKKFNFSLFKQSKKLEYSEWKLNSMLTRFITKY